MSNTLTIEGQLMYDYIKEIDEPEEALKKLATLNPQMGWGIHPERVRALAYAMWLQDHKKDWYPFYEKMIGFLTAIAEANTPGTMISIDKMGEIPEVPEGWTAPVKYLSGEIP